MEHGIISRYTWSIIGLAAVVIVASYLLVASGVGGEAGTAAVSDISEMLVVGLSATAILRSARILGVRAPVGRVWLLIGLGAASYAIGDTIWTVMEVGMGLEVPYPGLPDLFYLLEYPLFAAGIISAGMAFKGLVDLRPPARIAVAVGALLSAVVYFVLLRPFVFVEGVPFAEKLFSALYPLGDVALMIAPAVFVLGVVRALGGGRLAWPWWPVAAGTVVIALSDALYSWLSAADLYSSGQFVDFGWGIGHALVMVGALIARDLAAPRT
jgi:hypothetical protein